MNEVEMGRHVVEWLGRHTTAKIYEEVPGISGQRRPDIIMVGEDGVVEVVELKVKWTKAAVEQAAHWRDFANLITLAVAGPLRPRSWQGLYEKMGDVGLVEVRQVQPARILLGRYETKPWRKQELLDALDPVYVANTLAPAGSGSTQRYTAAQRTRQRLEERLAGIDEWVRFAPLVDTLRHHYTSSRFAKKGIRDMYDRGLIPSVKMDYHQGEWWIKGVE
jgi:hypothetical protein